MQMKPIEPEKQEIKCVVWDLDNTLWDGILLEDDDVQLRPHIKKIIQGLDSRGILLSIASKNNYEAALAKLDDFGLTEFFLYPEISWGAKSESIARIQKNLNIDMHAIMFIDDNPFERDEVQFIHPDITCIDAADYGNLLDDSRLNPRFITEDSRKRRLMYVENIKRKRIGEDYKGPRADFLASLQMIFSIAEANETDLQRAEELTVRTSQLNTTGRTYGYSDLNKLIDSNRHSVLIAELSDKYGSHGKIGLALIEMGEKYWHLKLFLMSCRVMSYGVGTAFLSYILKEAKKEGKKLRVDFIHNDRNKMMYVTFKFSNFKEIESDESGGVLLENDLSVIQDTPPYLDLIVC